MTADLAPVPFMVPPWEAEIVTRAFQVVEEQSGFNRYQLQSDSRALPLVRWRQILMWLLHDAGLTLEDIGEVVRRHHTTVLHGVRRIDAVSDLYPAFEGRLDRMALNIRPMVTVPVGAVL